MSAAARVSNLQDAISAIAEPEVGKLFTGIVVAVDTPSDRVSFVAGAVDEGGSDVTASTPFDIASITKVVAAAAALRMVEIGCLDLEEPAGQSLSGPLADVLGGATIRDLLAHTSGLRPGVSGLPPGTPWPVSLVDSFRANPWNWTTIASAARDTGPKGSVRYSDLNFLVLGHLLAERTGHPLDVIVTEQVLTPLGMSATTWGPRPEACATSPFDHARGVPIRGTVHDPSAYHLGGVAGSAGLFANVDDLLRFGHSFAHRRSGFLSEELVTQATSLQAEGEGNRRGLGWQLRPDWDDASSAAFSRDSFGHTGFTGTMLWVDPVRETVMVILTNGAYRNYSFAAGSPLLLCVSRIAAVVARAADTSVVE